MISPRAKGHPSENEGPDGEHVAASSQAIVLRMVGHGKHVLEVGCANGQMSRQLTARGNHVTGIDGDAEAIAEARAHCEEAVAADLDARPLYDVLPDRKYEVAVFDDVLERLRDPARVLRDTRSFLSDDGFVVISIPNVAHGNVRLSLLRGAFDYTPLGPLDRTHLRFFTLRSVRELCLRAGYRIDAIERTKVPLFVENDSVPRVDEREFSREIVDEIRRDREHDTLQFVLRAVPVSDFDHLGLALAELADAEARFADASAKVARLERRVAELDAAAERSAELEALVEALRGQLSAAETELATIGQDALGGPADVRRVLAEELDKYRDRDEALREALAEVNRLRAQLLEASRSIGEASALRIAVDKAYEALSAQHETMEAKVAERDQELARLRTLAAGASARLAEIEELTSARERELSEVASERGAALARLAHEHAAALAAARLAEEQAAESQARLRSEFEEARQTRDAAAAESIAGLESLVQERSTELEALRASLAETAAARDELEARLAEAQERAHTRERELVRIAEERSNALAALAHEHSSALADARADAGDAEEALAALRGELETVNAALRELEAVRATEAARLVEAEEVALAREASGAPEFALTDVVRDLEAARDQLAETASLRELTAARELELLDLQRELEAEREALEASRTESRAALEELQLSLAARAIELMDLQRETEAERAALVLAQAEAAASLADLEKSLAARTSEIFEVQASLLVVRREAEEERDALARRLLETEMSVEHLWESIAERELEMGELQRETEAERDALAARLAVAQTEVASLWESIVERENELMSLQRAAESERDSLAERLAEAEDVAIAREAAFAELLYERARPDPALGETVRRLEADLQRVREAHAQTVDLFKKHVDSDVRLVRSELAEIDGMIRLVQRSWAWSLKMLLLRVRRRLPGGRARVLRGAPPI